MVICSTCSAVLSMDREVCPTDGAKAIRVKELPKGALLGGYRVGDKLGEGGMGFVYEATHEVLGRRTALKLLRPEFAANESVVTRFLQEAKAVNLINHRHIVNVYDYGDDIRGLVYFVMEYLEGQTLSDLIDARQRLSPALWLHLFAQILKGLAAAHKKQIIHRDLKPDNIFLIARSGNPLFVKILDFGIAKLRGEGKIDGLTNSGALIGTPQFMSPEQFRGQPVDARSDVFSLGIIMYQAITGAMPFPGPELGALAIGILTKEPEPIASLAPGTPGSIIHVIETCLRKDAEARYADASVLLEALSEVHQEVDPENQNIVAALREQLGDHAAHIEPVLDPSWSANANAPRPGKKRAGAGGSGQKKRLAAAALGLALLGGGTAFFATRGDGGPGAAPAGSESKEGEGSRDQALLTALEKGELESLGTQAAARMQGLWDAAEPDARSEQLDALALVGSPAAAPILVRALSEGPALQVRAAQALADLGHSESSAALASAMTAASGQLQIDLAAQLLVLGNPAAEERLRAALGEPRLRVAAALALAKQGSADSSAGVLRDLFAETPPWKGRWLEAAEGLLALGEPEAKRALLATLEDENSPPEQSIAAAQLLAARGVAEGQKHLSDVVADARASHRESAALALAKLGNADALLYVPVGLMSDGGTEQVTAIAVLSRIGGDALEKQGPRLIEFAQQDNSATAMAALAALCNLQ